jgi:hypothetical protein
MDIPPKVEIIPDHITCEFTDSPHLIDHLYLVHNHQLKYLENIFSYTEDNPYAKVDARGMMRSVIDQYRENWVLAMTSLGRTVEDITASVLDGNLPDAQPHLEQLLGPITDDALQRAKDLDTYVRLANSS